MPENNMASVGCSSTPDVLRTRRPNLFSSEWMPYRRAFGQGLAQGAVDPREHWHLLLSELDQDTTENKDFSVFIGFIDGVDRIDEALAHEFLDLCAVHPTLSRGLVKLHPRRALTETDLNRCMSLLEKTDTCPFMFDTFLWDKKCRHLPASRVLELTERLLALESGEAAILNGLGMRLFDIKTTDDMPGPELLHIGLRAAIQVLQRETDLRGNLVDVDMESVVAAAPLSGVDIETLIRWCASTDDPGVWAFIPQGLDLWVSVSDSSGTVLHKNAVKFLEAAPEPSVVLESFADLTSPTSSIGRTGHIASILQAGADAFGELIDHRRADISKAARDIHESLMLMIERQRDREQQKDREGEQRFE
jgi:hypothetical protein